MKRYTIYYAAVGVVIGLFLLTSGCRKKETQSPNPAIENASQVQLGLKTKTGQIDSYRLKTVSQRKVTLEGPQPENRAAFQGGQTTDRVEMVFDRQVQTIEASGNAIEKITIKELKYFGEVRDKPVVDFNSVKDKDPNNALLALIGQNYTIEVTPSGKVSKIIDANNARAAIRKISSNNDAAAKLLTDKTIEKRHSVPLPDEKHNELKTGDKWSDVVSTDFGLMGIRAYERTFVLDKIEKTGANKIAVIGMSAIPSILDANDTRRGTEAVPPMTDVKQTYTGTIKIDVTSGALLQYQENLKNEWLIVPPGTGQSGPPTVLNMTAIQSYNMEKLK
jgi:hypothetical protein